MTPDPPAQRDLPRLLYPFYLDTDMSMAFSAALTGGVALEEEQLERAGATSEAVKNLRGNLKLWRVGGFDAGRSQTDRGDSSSESRLVRRHTVASIFIDLYDELRRTGQLAEDPDLNQVSVGDIISFRSGPAIAPLRRIVDQLLRLLELMWPVMQDDATHTEPVQNVSRQQRRAAARDRARQAPALDDEGLPELERVRRLITAVRDDLDHSGVIDIAIQNDENEDDTSVVLMLDKRFISPPTLELIHTSSFTVVGRVTNAWREPDTFVNLYRRSVLSLLPALTQTIVWAMFAFLGSIASSLDVAAMEKLARESIGHPDPAADDSESPDEAPGDDSDSSVSNDSPTDVSDQTAADAAEIETDEITVGEDIAALTPVVQAPAIQVLPLAICS